MKLWELDSVFREDRTPLKRALENARWAAFKRDFEDMRHLVNKQDRTKLDQELPEDLVLETLQHLNLTFSVKKGYLCLAEDNSQGISAVEVARRYGGSIIEEVLEGGCAAVPGMRASD